MIEILATLPFTAIQDLGRPGQRDIGLVTGGVMDRLALAAANRLVGNPDNTAGLEIEMPPVRLLFHKPALIAVTGAECPMTLQGRVLPPWWCVAIAAREELEILPPRHGQRAYLAVRGGIEVPLVLKGRGTVLRNGFGGVDGRVLRAGDQLAVGEGNLPNMRDEAGFGMLPARLALPPAFHPDAQSGDVVLRVVPAAEFDSFDDASRTWFLSMPWTVTRAGNRQGMRLEGEALKRTEATEMRSHPIMPGVVQVPPSGQPIIQLADGNSAGGYPKIGVVIEADQWRLAQVKPGTRLRFLRCARGEAGPAFEEMAKFLSKAAQVADYCGVPALVA